MIGIQSNAYQCQSNGLSRRVPYRRRQIHQHVKEHADDRHRGQHAERRVSLELRCRRLAAGDRAVRTTRRDREPGLCRPAIAEALKDMDERGRDEIPIRPRRAARASARDATRGI